MKTPIYSSAVLLLVVFLTTVRGAPSTESAGVDSSSGSRRPELEYLEGRKHCRATARSTVTLSADGTILERQPAG